MADLMDSRLGSLLVSLYAIASIVLAITSYICPLPSCGLLIVVPILPWAAIMGGQLGLPVPWGTYPLILLLNAAVLYIVGASIEWLYERYWREREDLPSAQ